jgi:hypothetical protein
MFSLLFSQVMVNAQPSPEAVYAKYMQVTSMFHGKTPYTCLAIAAVKYKKDAKGMRDTSRLIYKNGMTYYKSRLVERLEDARGELILNHQLKTAVLNVSDSVREAAQKVANIKPDEAFEALLDSNVEAREQAEFRNFVTQQSNVSWTTNGDMDEITITPQKPGAALLTSIRIRFTKDMRVRYYEYTSKDAYATDIEGRAKYRVITTIYDNFNYDNVPNIPAKVSDYLVWSGWTIKLKKYTNYKLSVL